jgi:uncharacterized protein (TIGR00730 family)
MEEHGVTHNVFPSAEEDAEAALRATDTPQTRSPSYRLAFSDPNFLLRDELRPVRLQLELLKPELLQQEYGIDATVVIFGSTRIPDGAAAAQRLAQAEAQARQDPANADLACRVDIARRVMAKAHYYDKARRLGYLITTQAEQAGMGRLVVITGGGPGIMEAANRGAHDAGGPTIGLNIVLPHEQCPNPYITPALSFQFHYFAIRKMHFLLRAKALVTFPGGYGTLDELFETLTLIQTHKVQPVPILLFGEDYWRRIVNFEELVAEGTIDPKDLELFQYVATAEEAWEAIVAFYRDNSGAGA